MSPLTSNRCCLSPSYPSFSPPLASPCPPPQEIECTRSQYCPSNSTLPATCPPGFYCETPAEMKPCNLSSYCGAGSVSDELCEAGYYCVTPSSKKQCEIGSWCPPGSTSMTPCPASFYCPKPNIQLTQYGCTKPGSYCPEGSREEAACEPGFYCSTPASKEMCRKGYTCQKSSTAGLPCVVGSYNDRVGAVDESSCHPCPERRTTVSEASIDVSDCVCSRGHYIGDDEECVECVNGLVCNSTALASVNVTVMDGYFPIRSGTSISALMCLIPAACQGSSCSPGHRGFLCNACEGGYFKAVAVGSAGGECTSCNQNGWRNSTEFLAAMSLLGLLLYFMFYFKIKKSIAMMRTMSRATTFNIRAESESIASIIQRMLLSQFQLMGILSSFNITWPPEVSALIASMNSVSSVGVGNVFGGGIKCLLYIPSVPDPVNELLVAVYLMLGGVSSIVLFWSFIRWRKSLNQIVDNGSSPVTELSVMQNITICIVGLFYLLYSQVLRLWFKLFNCESFNYDAKLRLTGALDIECWSSSHLQWIGLMTPIFLVVIVGMPLFVFLKMLKASYRGVLHGNVNIAVSYGFLFEGNHQPISFPFPLPPQLVPSVPSSTI